MNSIEKAIKIAVENGYDAGNPNSALRTSGAYLMEREFWQALGKGLGWYEGLYMKLDYATQDGVVQEDGNEAKFHWHRFIDHLEEGKDAESYFTSLLKEK